MVTNRNPQTSFTKWYITLVKMNFFLIGDFHMKIFHVIGNETFYEIGNFGDWFIQFSQIKQNYL